MSVEQAKTLLPGPTPAAPGHAGAAGVGRRGGGALDAARPRGGRRAPRLAHARARVERLGDRAGEERDQPCRPRRRPAHAGEGPAGALVHRRAPRGHTASTPSARRRRAAGIIMGHSRAAAWGMTASGVDLHDHYVEKVNPADPHEYLTPDGWKLFEERHETVAVRGRAEPVALDVLWSRHGPVIDQDAAKHEAIAWRWAGFDFSPATAVASLLAIPTSPTGRRSGVWWGRRRRRVQLGLRERERADWLRHGLPCRSGPVGHGASRGRLDGRARVAGLLPARPQAARCRSARGWVANANNAPDTSGPATRSAASASTGSHAAHPPAHAP